MHGCIFFYKTVMAKQSNRYVSGVALHPNILGPRISFSKEGTVSIIPSTPSPGLQPIYLVATDWLIISQKQIVELSY